VIVDLRAHSPTYQKWFATELSADNRRMLYIPKGFAHGFQTLTDGCEVFYQISEFHVPEAARVRRWNDPALGIVWPFAPTMMSARDARAAHARAEDESRD
jgi:dTDP-4-dehydrorhamnose 3,5-epimerase